MTDEKEERIIESSSAKKAQQPSEVPSKKKIYLYYVVVGLACAIMIYILFWANLILIAVILGIVSAYIYFLGDLEGYEAEVEDIPSPDQEVSWSILTRQKAPRSSNRLLCRHLRPFIGEKSFLKL